MNTLGYRCIEENGLSFELLVDDQTLSGLIGGIGSAIPYWIIETDLPYLPPCGAEHDPEIRIVTVCECGEYGCGHTQCRVDHNGNVVLFYDFDVGISREGLGKIFEFTRSNYEEVMSAIVRLSSRKRTDQEPAVPRI